MTRLEQLVVANPSKVIGFIAILVCIILVLVIYYHGIFSFGPYYVKSAYSEDLEKLIKLVNDGYSKR